MSPPRDDRVEHALLSLLLAFDAPDGLHIDELVAELGDRAATLRALAALEAAGLVQRLAGDRAAPTLAARRFDELNI